MMMAYSRSLGLFVLVAAPAAGCIISSDDDDGNASAGTGGSDSLSGPVSMSASDPSVSTSGPTSGPTSETDDTNDSGELPEGCSENLLEDPGFEGGTPSDVWTETSQVFESPICDASCTDQDGAEPYAGDWWAWYGGIEQSDQASVSQAITIPAGSQAFLQFRLWINTGAGTGNDIFYVDIDETNVFEVSDLAEAEYDPYTLESIAVDEFADGDMHTVTFGAEISGDGLTNFFLDNVLLVSCSDGGGSSTTMAPETMTDTDVATSATMTDTDTDTDTGSGTAGPATMGTTM